MALSPEQTAEMHELLWAVRAGTASADELARLERMVCDDPEARAFYVRYMHLCADLRWSLSAHAKDEQGAMNAASVNGEPTVQAAMTDSAAAGPIIFVAGDQSPAFGNSPLLSFPTFLFSYILAALLLGLGVLVGWVWKVSERAAPEQQIAGSPTSGGPVENVQWVGRVSGLFDCRWAERETEAFSGARVSLGRKYALASGLMEITYDTGARVILQGPCTYVVENASGGYLSLGRLTARVETKGGTGMAEGGEANQVLTSPNLQISKSPNLNSPLAPSAFVIRTPTAIVTDLGTEFGVEYDRSGVTRSSVLLGRVSLQAVSADGKRTGVAQILIANQSARVEVGQGRAARVVLDAGPVVPFVRETPKRTPIKLFNTGMGLKPGNRDPHWQIAARSDDRAFRPQSAIVFHSEPWYVDASHRAQWISAAGDGMLPPEVSFTFRTTFDLTGMRPATAILHGRFVADNRVTAIRLNGHEVRVPKHGIGDYDVLHSFSATSGFVAGANVLEVVVENTRNLQGEVNPSLMGVLIVLDGSAISTQSERSATPDSTERRE